METQMRSEETLAEFNVEILHLMSPPPPEAAGGSSFTALLELPPTQAVELLHSPESQQTPPVNGVWRGSNYPLLRGQILLPGNMGLLERASRLSVFAAEREGEEREEVGMVVKQEPSDLDSNPGSLDRMGDGGEQRSSKRKEREKVIESKKKKKSKSKSTTNGNNDEDEKLPYVHVRARRGQATDSHSLAERARREKINARMKLLQELVPGCNKISGTAMVLDEIINHVQSLQRQVEFLSMRLATVNPRIDFDIDSLLTAQGGSSLDSNFHSMVMPFMWPDGQINMTREQYVQLCNFDGLHHIPDWGREDKPNFIAPDNSFLSYVSSTNSASMPNQLKNET